MEAPLYIPLTESPSRRLMRQAAFFGGLALAAWCVVLGTYRLVFAWDSVFAPDAATHIRIPKTDTTQAALRSVAKGVTIIPELPIALSDLVTGAKRNVDILINDQGTTIVLDRSLPESERAWYSDLGLLVETSHGQSTLSTTAQAPMPKTSLVHGIVQTLFSSMQPSLTTQSGTITVRMDHDTISLLHYTALQKPTTRTAITQQTLLLAAFSPQMLSGLTQRAFTQNTPGVAALFSLAAKQGIDVALERDNDAIAYTMSVPLSDSTRSEVNESLMESAARELTEVPSIEGISTYLSDGNKTLTLRSREEASVVLRDESPYRFLTATSSFGTVTFTQTPSTLTITNNTSLSETSITPPCLPHAVALAKPEELGKLFPAQTHHTPRSLQSWLLHAKTIASDLQQTRICFTE